MLLHEVPLGAYPTVEEARLMIGVERRHMRRYTEGADWDERLHPQSVFALAEDALRDRRLDRSFNRIAAQLIYYATVNCPDDYPTIVDTMEALADDFLGNRERVDMQPRLSTTLQKFFTMETWVIGGQVGFIERDGDTYF